MSTDIKAWEAPARRGLLGPKHEIEALGKEHSFRPRKYSVDADAEIKAIAQQTAAKVPREVIAKLAKGMKRKDVTAAELVNDLEPDDLASLLEASSAITGQADLIRVKLKHGIGEQDLEEGDITAELVDRILNYSDVAAEMLAVIEDWNLPLPKRSAGTSPTSPSGSTSEQDSPQE